MKQNVTKQLTSLKQAVKEHSLKLYQRVKARVMPNHQAELAVNEPAHSSNPYIAARLEWNHQFSDLIKAKLNWQRISFISGMANVLLIVGLILVSLQTKVVPYAVKVDQLGNASFAGFLQKGVTINPLEINAFIRRYLSDAREVIADPVAQKQSLAFVYATTLGNATSFLNQYYRSNSPFTAAQKTTTQVVIDAVLPKSTKTWQVDWTETQRGLNGDIINQMHYEALVTVEHKAVSNAQEVDINPLGLFVTNISWSQQT